MASLKDKANNILDEKTTNLLPENIKKDITVLGVMGTYNGPDTGIKLFETLEEMNSDTNAKEEDLAVVYRNEITNMTSDSVVSSITFPETVTLQSAFTDSHMLMLRAVDQSVMFDGQVELSDTSFRFNGYTDNGMIRVKYSSANGITYNRTSFTGDSGDLTNPVELNTNVKVENVDEWVNELGQFMLVGGNIFDGLYEYKLNVQTDDFNFPNLETATLNVGDDGDFIYNDILPNVYSLNKLNSILFETEYGIVFIDTNNNLKLLCSDIKLDRILVNADKSVIGLCSINTTGNVAKLYTINYETLELSNEQNLDLLTYGSSNYLYVAITDIKSAPVSLNLLTRSYTEFRTGIINTTLTKWNWSENINLLIYKNKYVLASTQLSALPENIYNAIAYGKDGIINGNITGNVSNSFADINAEIYYKLQNIYDSMQPRVLTDEDKTIDRNIYFIPINNKGKVLLDLSQLTNASNLFGDCDNLKYIPNLDTSNITDMSYMLQSCDNLVTIPVLNTQNAINMQGMFRWSTSLSDESLNNILEMCVNATKISSNKTLNYIGLTQEQAAKCTTLSNYEAFTSAGWTTGY